MTLDPNVGRMTYFINVIIQKQQLKNHYPCELDTSPRGKGSSDGIQKIWNKIASSTTWDFPISQKEFRIMKKIEPDVNFYVTLDKDEGFILSEEQMSDLEEIADSVMDNNIRTLLERQMKPKRPFELMIKPEIKPYGLRDLLAKIKVNYFTRYNLLRDTGRKEPSLHRVRAWLATSIGRDAMDTHLTIEPCKKQFDLAMKQLRVKVKAYAFKANRKKISTALTEMIQLYKTIKNLYDEIVTIEDMRLFGERERFLAEIDKAWNSPDLFEPNIKGFVNMYLPYQIPKDLDKKLQHYQILQEENVETLQALFEQYRDFENSKTLEEMLDLMIKIQRYSNTIATLQDMKTHVKKSSLLSFIMINHD